MRSITKYLRDDLSALEHRSDALHERLQVVEKGEEWRKRTRDLDGRFEESMRRLNKWADHVEECLRMVDSNRDQNDNVHELIFRNLGVDVDAYGDPPTMTAEQIAGELGMNPATPAVEPHKSLNERVHVLENTVRGINALLTDLANDTETGPGRIDALESLVAKLVVTTVPDLSNRVEAHMHPVEGRRPYEVRTGPPYPAEDPTFTMEEEEMIKNGVIQPHAFEDTPAAQDDGPGEDDEAKWEQVHAAYECAPIETGYPEFKAAIAKAIDLGLAVSPDDPRLAPLEVSDEDVDLILLICKTAYENGGHVSDRLAAIILKAIRQSLAVSPDDPRLAPLEVSEDDLAEIRKYLRTIPEYVDPIPTAIESYASRVNAARGYTEVVK